MNQKRSTPYTLCNNDAGDQKKGYYRLTLHGGRKG